MMDYPLGKKINKYLDFFVANLRYNLHRTRAHLSVCLSVCLSSYDDQSGQESVIETLTLIFTKFPEVTSC